MGSAEKFSETSACSGKDALTANKFLNELAPTKISESGLSGTVSESLSVLKNLAYGAVDELVNHKMQILSDVAMGAGFVALNGLTPKSLSGPGSVLMGAAFGKMYRGNGDLWQSGKTTAGPALPDFQSKFEEEQNIRKLGAAAVDISVAVVAGFLTHRFLGRSVGFRDAGAINEMSALNTSGTVGNVRFADVLKRARLNGISYGSTLDRPVLNPPAFRRFADKEVFGKPDE